MKEYGIGAQILKSLGVKHMRLIAETKVSDFAGLGGFGLDVVETINPTEGI
jgi:3,4-dihydroxy 2-butanone 4-phosphate synthase / GTP cyclohydrolase II